VQELQLALALQHHLQLVPGPLGGEPLALWTQAQQAAQQLAHLQLLLLLSDLLQEQLLAQAQQG